ncbi:MAG: hypothetical protein LBM97_01365 [Candidatus Nomurabacteria bacterium]|jgi:hypothetical protein|nr:hypothetical protein [Candidatus Nomurabacteria bacterium]
MRKQYDLDEKIDMIEIIIDNFNKILRGFNDWDIEMGLTDELVEELEAGIKKIKQANIEFDKKYPD